MVQFKSDEEARAWDRYAAGGLAAFTDAENAAAEADRLLAYRRSRFVDLVEAERDATARLDARLDAVFPRSCATTSRLSDVPHEHSSGGRRG